MISVLLQPLKYVLWPRRCSILVNVPCESENNVYSAVAGQCSVNVNQILLVEAGVEV